MSAYEIQRVFPNTIDRINGLKQVALSKLIRALGLPSASKRKSDMANAIEQYLYTARSRNDAGIVYAVRSLVLLSENEQQLPEFANVLAQVRMQIRNTMNPQSVQQREVAFKKSAFYKIVAKVSADGTNPIIASKEPEDLNISRISFTLTDREREILSRPDHRLCAFASPLDEFKGEKYIEFPIPCKLIVNNTEVPGNYKGIKGKKSSVVPWDITSAVKREEKNYITIKYAYTTCDFIFYFYLIQTIKVESLVSEVLAQPHIPMEKTLSMIKESEQDDISASKETLSLLCPCSYVRMEYPVRSVKCNHIQCFDIYSYLLLQEKGPTWLCPVCYHKIKLSHLEVDEYFDSIIKSTGPEYDYVEIRNDGTWTPQEYLNDTLAPSKILPSNGHVTTVNPDVRVKQEDGDVIKFDIGKLVLADSDANGNTIFEVQEFKRRSAKTSTPVVQQNSAVLDTQKPLLQTTITPPIANKASVPPADVIEILSEEEGPIDAADMSNQLQNIQLAAVIPPLGTNGTTETVRDENVRMETSSHPHSLVSTYNTNDSYSSNNGVQRSGTAVQPNIPTNFNVNSSVPVSNAQHGTAFEHSNSFRGTTAELPGQQNSILSSQSQPQSYQQQQLLSNPQPVPYSDQLQSMRVRQRVQRAQLEAQQRQKTEKAQKAQKAHLVEQARQAQVAEQAKQAQLAQQAQQAQQAHLVEQARRAQVAEQAKQAKQAQQAQQAHLVEQARRAQAAEQLRQAQEAQERQERLRQQKLAEAERRRTDVNGENFSTFSPSMESPDISTESSVERCRSIAKELKFMSKTSSLLNSMYLNYVWSDLKTRELVVNEAHSLRGNDIPLPDIMNDQYRDSSKSIVSFMSFSFDICCSILLQIVTREQNFSRTLDSYLRMQIPKLQPQHGEIYNEFCMKLYFNDASYRIYHRLAIKLNGLLGSKDNLNYMDKKLKLIDVLSEIRSDLSAFFRNPSTSVFYKLSIIRLAKSLSHCGFPFKVIQESDLGEIYRIKVLEQRLSSFDNRNFNINEMSTASYQAETQNFTSYSAGANGSISQHNSFSPDNVTQSPGNASRDTGNVSERVIPQSYEATNSYGTPQVPQGALNTALHNRDKMQQHAHINSNQLRNATGATTSYTYPSASTQSRDNFTAVDADRRNAGSLRAPSSALETLQAQKSVTVTQDLGTPSNNCGLQHTSEQTPLSASATLPQSSSTTTSVNLVSTLPNSSTTRTQDLGSSNGKSEKTGSGSFHETSRALQEITVQSSENVSGSGVPTEIPIQASTVVENGINTPEQALVERSPQPSVPTPKDTHSEASIEKLIENPVVQSEKPAETLVEAPADIPIAKITQEPVEKPTEKHVEKFIAQPAKALAEVPASRLAEKSTEAAGSTVEKPAEHVPGTPNGSGNLDEQSIEKLIQKFAQKPGEGNAKSTGNKPAIDTDNTPEKANSDHGKQLQQSRGSSVQETKNSPSETHIEQAKDSTSTQEVSVRKDHETEVSLMGKVLSAPTLLNNANRGISKPITISPNAIKTKSNYSTPENQNVVANTLKALENNRRSLSIKYAGLAGLREKSLREKSQMSDKVIQLIEKAKADQLARKQKMQEILAKPLVRESSQLQEVDKVDKEETDKRQKVSEVEKEETDKRQKVSEIEKEVSTKQPKVLEGAEEKIAEKQKLSEVEKEEPEGKQKVFEVDKEVTAENPKAPEAEKEVSKECKKTKDKTPPPAAEDKTQSEDNGSTNGGLLGFSLPSSVRSFLKPSTKKTGENERAVSRVTEDQRPKSRERREDKDRPAVSDEIKSKRQRESGPERTKEKEKVAKSGLMPNSSQYEGDLPPLHPPALPPVHRQANNSNLENGTVSVGGGKKETLEGRRSPVSSSDKGSNVSALHRAGKHSRVTGHDDRERGVMFGMKKRKTVKIPQQPQRTALPAPQQPSAPQQQAAPPQHHGSNDLLRMFKQSANDVSGVFKERKGSSSSSGGGSKKKSNMGRGGAGRNVSLVEPEIIDLTLDD